MNATLLHRRAPPVPPAASFYVPQIPLLPPTSASTPPLTVSAGYLPARPPAAGQSGPAGDAHLYFVLERARHVADRRRLIIWFNGGPGCSSFDGLMMEIGPFRPDQKGGIEWTTPGGAWNEYADVLYLDQPVGTGFSYASTSDYAHTLPQAAEEVRYFLQQFVEVYPEYKRGNGVDTYLAGESYAGQYIPFTGAALIDTPGGSPVDLKGIAIGNGFIDPKSQAGSELDMMIEAGIWTKDSNEFKQAYKQVEQCRNAITETKGNPREIAPCARILHQIIDMTTQKVSGKLMCINIYDVRLSDTSPDCGMNWPPTIKPTYDYLARGDVRKALHVNEAAKPEAWIECNHRVGSALREKDPQSSVVHLPKILDAGVQVLLFAGDQDLICNHIGVERIPANLDWSHAKDWQTQAVKRDWVVNNTAAGYWRTANNLTYVSIADGSHMVGYDKPVQSHDMMLRFMGVDLMGAAGPSARIPSRVEGQPDRMLVVGGGGGGIADDRPMIPGVDGKSEEQVKEEAKWAAYYNAGSAALIILLILVAAGTYVLLRLRRNARGVSLGRGRGGRGRPSALDTEEGEHELEHLTAVNPDDEAEGDTLGVPERGESSAARYNDSQETFRPQRQQLGKRAAVGDDETIFDVGAGSDEDEEDRRP